MMRDLRNLKVQIKLPPISSKSSAASPLSALARLSKRPEEAKTLREDLSPISTKSLHQTHFSSSPKKRRSHQSSKAKPTFSQFVKVTRPPLSPEDLVLGKCLGRGKLGRVVRAEVGSQEFAVKLVHKSALRYAEAEREALNKLVHPRLVKMHNYTENSEQAFILLDLIQGEDLFHAMRRKRLTRAEISKIAAQVLIALEAIHSGGFVYRDLKPENIMVLPSGDIKLIDFGFAKKLTEDRTFTKVGSPEYMAPEVIMDEGHCKAADWWSYGVLLYEMLCGQTPFRCDSIQDTYNEIVSCNLEFSRNIEPSAKDIIRKLLTRDQDLRLGSLAGGARDLKLHKFFVGVDWESVGAHY
jgi:protein kinase A